MEHEFLTYLRTKQLFNQRLKDTDNSVQLHKTDLWRFNVSEAQLKQMVESGQLQHTATGYKVLQPGKVDFNMIKNRGAELTNLHKWMRQILLFIDFPKDKQTTDYFNAFLKVRNQHLDLFFTVDKFSRRVHTPITSLSRDLRPFIKLCGDPVASLDIAQMQPMLLARVLHDHIGKNSFSDALFNGKDIYSMLQSKAGLQSREEAKKRFFEVAFSCPNNDLEKLFGAENWIRWVNGYKNTHEPRNPHSEKRHSNLAWLLQSYEVTIMTKIWRKLAEFGIPFLTVHDEIICQRSDAGKVEKIMNSVLSGYFRTFKINIK